MRPVGNRTGERTKGRDNGTKTKGGKNTHICTGTNTAPVILK